MKPTFNIILKRAAMTLLLALTTTVSSWAQITGGQTDFITDVMLIGGTESEMNTMKTNYQNKGWTVIDQNLNEGAGGDFIYLLYKTANIYSTFDYTFITDFYISTAKDGVPETLTYDGRTYFLTNYNGDYDFTDSQGDLNNNAGGDNIHLYYTKEYGTYRDAVSRIFFDSTQSYAVGKNGGSTGYNLNSNAGGKKIYMHRSLDQVFGWTIMKNYYGDLCMITGYEGPTDNITSITIPLTIENSTVESIDMDFSGFINLETMTFSDGTVIEQMPSVQGCEKLKKVFMETPIGKLNELPTSIKTIPDDAFAGTALQDLTLSNVTSIGSRAFEGCNYLEALVISKPSSIGYRAFADIRSSSTLVVYYGPLSNWSPNKYEYSPNLYICGEEVNNWYCGWCGGKEESDHNRLYWKVEGTQTVNNYDYGHLTIDCDEDDVAYPEAQIIKSHTWRAFSQALMRIESLTLRHVYALEANEFKDFIDLKTAMLSSDLTSIGAGVFSGCTQLTDIYFDGTQAQWDAVTKEDGWKPASTKEHWHCTVTFNANGHGTAPASQSIRWSNEDKATEPTALSASGYVFTGWYTDAACTTPWDFDNAVPGDMTLYAGWAEKQLALNDGSANDLTPYNGQKYTVKLQDRTLYLDGDWNTLCLPFSLNSLTGTPLEGFTVKELDTSTENNGHKTGSDNGTLYLNFKDAKSITAGKPYILRYVSDLVISTEAEWNTFAQNVSNGSSYEGKVVRLDADINVSTMAGKDGFPFKGTLDGNGHTINLNLRGGGQGLALFYIIDGATIQNVKVTGTVTSSYHRPATFAAFVDGSSTIRNCRSSVDIVSTHNNAWIDGGAFVSRVAGGVTLTMTDCAFTGSVTYNDNTYSGGSMVGFTQSGAKANLTNCMYFPTALALTAVAYNPHIFVSGDERGNLTNCYYNAVAKASILENEGFDGSSMSTDALASALGVNWEVGDNNAIPKWAFKDPVFRFVTINASAPKTVTSSDGTVGFTGNYNPVVIAKSGDKTKLYIGTDNAVCYPEISFNINAFRAYFQLGKNLVVSSIGDVNGDRGINVTDVTFLVNYILGNANSNFIVKNADVSGDGTVTVTDVTSLVNLILNNSNNDIQNVVINGADGLTFSDGGNGPARVSQK